MEKVWFKLRQTDYPPPTPKSLGTQTDTGPITLGHFIPSLQNIDFVLNRGAVKPFPRSMSVYRTESTPFTWNLEKGKSAGAGAGAGAPIAAMAGVTLEASVEFAFARSVQSPEAYERLDTYIVQPGRTYIQACLGEADLAAHVQGKLLWSIFMITGIKVARKGSRTTSEQTQQSAAGNITMEFPEIANLHAHTNFEQSNRQDMTSSSMTDFVWAVRLAKISGNRIMNNWSLGPYTDRATFTNEERIDVRAMVESEGLDGFALVEDQCLNETIVLGIRGSEN